MPTEEQITDALAQVIDPELRKNIVELGMVRSIEPGEDGRVDIARVADHGRLPDPLPLPGRRAPSTWARSRASQPSRVDFDVLTDSEKQTLQQRLGRQGRCPRARSRG